MGDSTGRARVDKSQHSLLNTDCSVGDRVMASRLIETDFGVIMPREWVTVTRVTDKFIEIISDRFIYYRFALA